jgi:hypothetical protein
MLPWNNVGMMLKGRDQNFIARLQARAQKTLGYQVDCLGSSTCEYHFLAGAGIDEAAHFFTRTFKLISGTLAERMNTPVNVGVILLVILTDGIDDNLRMLARCCIVQIDQRMSIHLLVQDREVGTDAALHSTTSWANASQDAAMMTNYTTAVHAGRSRRMTCRIQIVSWV